METSSHTDRSESLLSNLKDGLDHREKRILSPNAAFSADAIRSRSKVALRDGYRQAYALDADRIMHMPAISTKPRFFT
jgi:dGTPase